MLRSSCREEGNVISRGFPTCTCMWYSYLTADSVCKSLFDMQSVVNSKQSTSKQLMSKEILKSRLHAAFRSFYGCCNDLLCQYNLPLILGLSDCVSYQSVSRSWHTDLDHDLYRITDLEIGLTAVVTGRQGEITPLWHLTPPLVYPEIHVCHILAELGQLERSNFTVCAKQGIL
jgi:hypothetical protein